MIRSVTHSMIPLGIIIWLIESAHASSTTLPTALNETEIRDAVESAIRMNHPHENGNWWKSLGPKTPDILISLYRADATLYEKIRLIDGMAWFDTPEVVAFLKSEYESNSNDVIKTAAVRSIVISQGMKEETFINKALLSADPRMRMGIGKILSASWDPKARKRVERMIANEKTDWVLIKLKKQLKNEQKKDEKKSALEKRANKPSLVIVR